MEYTFYKIKTLSNTHVGSGQNSYGIVDNIVQKDVLTEYPCMNSTSLKGALREWMEKELHIDIPNLESIYGFGNKKKDKKEVDQKTNQQGTHNFFQANLLSYPMRSNKVQHFNVTCPKIISDLKTNLNLFGITQFDSELDNLINANPAEKPISLAGTENAIIEMHDIVTMKKDGLDNSDKIKSLFGNNLVIMNDDQFNKLIKKLPVITRNNLENGQSTNLFYEEVVPRETYFGFLIGCKNDMDIKFDSEIGVNKLFQIGANATVGYGCCELTKLN